VLRHARQNGVRVHPLVQVDPDTIARWMGPRRRGAQLRPAGGKAFVDMPDDATLAQLAQKLGVAWREWVAQDG
jgi:hypothetical protein